MFKVYFVFKSLHVIINTSFVPKIENIADFSKNFDLNAGDLNFIGLV